MIYLFALASIIGIFVDCFSKEISLKKLYICFLILLFSLFACNRLSNVPDTEAYINFILYIEESISKFGLFYYSNTYEIGFESLVRFLVVIGFNYKAIFFIIALIISSVGAIIFNDKRLPIAAWLLFSSFYGIYFSFIILRAGLSIVFFGCFIKFAKSKKFIALISLVLSFLFHKSMLFALFIYVIAFFFKSKSVKKETIVIVIFFIFYITSIGNLCIVKLLNYLDKFINFSLWNRFVYYLSDFRVESFNISIRLIFNIVVYLLSRYLKTDIKNCNSMMDKLVYGGILINLLAGSNTVVGRMVDYLLIFNIPNYLILLKSIKYKFIIPDKELQISNIVVIRNTCALNSAFLRMIILTIFILINLFFIVRIIF